MQGPAVDHIPPRVPSIVPSWSRILLALKVIENQFRGELVRNYLMNGSLSMEVVKGKTLMLFLAKALSRKGKRKAKPQWRAQCLGDH